MKMTLEEFIEWAPKNTTTHDILHYWRLEDSEVSIPGHSITFNPAETYLCWSAAGRVFFTTPAHQEVMYEYAKPALMSIEEFSLAARTKQILESKK